MRIGLFRLCLWRSRFLLLAGARKGRKTVDGGAWWDVDGFQSCSLAGARESWQSSVGSTLDVDIEFSSACGLRFGFYSQGSYDSNLQFHLK